MLGLTASRLRPPSRAHDASPDGSTLWVDRCEFQLTLSLPEVDFGCWPELCIGGRRLQEGALRPSSSGRRDPCREDPPSTRCRRSRSFAVRRHQRAAAGGALRGRWLWRSSLRSDCPGLAGRAGPCGPAVRQARTVPRTVRVRAHLLASRGCRITRFVRCAHCAQTGCGKSVYEARCARPPRGCAARRHTQRPRRAPPAAQPTEVAVAEAHHCLPQRGVRAGRGVRVRRRAAQGSWPARAARFVD